VAISAALPLADDNLARPKSFSACSMRPTPKTRNAPATELLISAQLGNVRLSSSESSIWLGPFFRGGEGLNLTFFALNGMKRNANLQNTSRPVIGA